MKIFKSIKWRLQLWYGLILVVVLAGFGFTAFQLERGQVFRGIDDELNRRADILGATLHHPPRREDRPPPDQLPEDQFPPMLQENRAPHAFHLRPEDEILFGSNDPHNFYFKIISIRNQNDEIAKSTNQPPNEPMIEAHFPQPKNSFSPFPNQFAKPVPRTFAHYHAILKILPSGEMIEVGCSISNELEEIRNDAIMLTLIGGVILLIGLAGGWWFVGRSLKPISEISLAAVKISAGDLSQRINVAEAESELGQLAAVLNSTFARLEAAFAQQQQFTSDAAHELRTPVSVILTQTQTALNREREAADYKQTVEACQRAAQRMRKLIESLLALARLDAGQEMLKRLRFDFSKTISDCIELVKPMADERGVKIFSELAPLEITGDSERLVQVVTNLLTNAIQYNHDEGEVRVKLELQNGLAILSVSDNGVGIPSEDLPRVFERFYRADKSRSSGNAGLGLAISKAIVEAHGGTIEISSTEDVGTVFIVRLPI
ncbi:MAG TPA: ATP-binding protein [Verrucomicrobiae bacterium]|nr:ATP-binding protein [Verrucomicrobiae bacterium]